MDDWQDWKSDVYRLATFEYINGEILTQQILGPFLGALSYAGEHLIRKHEGKWYLDIAAHVGNQEERSPFSIEISTDQRGIEEAFLEELNRRETA